MTKWLELAHETRGHVFPTFYYWRSVQLASKIVNKSPDTFGIWLKDDGFSWMTRQGSFVKIAQAILKKIESDYSFIKKIEQVNKTQIPLMIKQSEWFAQDLSPFSGTEIYENYIRWEQLFFSLMEYSVIGTILEFEEPLLSNKLVQLLSKKTKNAGKIFGTLTMLTRRTSVQDEELELCAIKLKQFEGKDIKKDIEKHHKKYAWIPFNYDGPGWTRSDVEHRLEAMSPDRSAISRKIKELDSFPNLRKKEQESIEKKLGLTDHERYLFEVLRMLGYWKFERKSMNSKSHWMMDNLMNEIARKCNIAIEDAKSILPTEMKEVLTTNKVNRNTLKKRRKLMIVEFEGYDFIHFIEDKEAIQTEKQILKDLQPDTMVKELKGSTAYPGSAKGTVKIVNTVADMNGFNKGDILVSASTSPDILSAMSKAAAIVTDSGGITCHAAIVARELKVPTVIGTKMASKVLKNGMVVEVDATHAVVYLK